MKHLLAAALLLNLGGCAQMAANRAAAQAAQDADNSRLAQLRERYNTDPAFHAQVERAQYAIDYCANQAAYANATTRGLLQAGFASIEVQASCIDFYKRTGHLPGQTF